jgi:hypothetical protein
MTEPDERAPGADDTAAFQRFYGSGLPDDNRRRGLVYRLLIAWWRDRT